MYLRSKTSFYVIVVLLAVSPGFAHAASKSPPVKKVPSSLVRKINGTTCAYLPTTKKTSGLKNSWTAGVRKGSKGFVAHSSAAAFYKSKGPRSRTAYRRALSDAKAGSKNCRRLTALKFKTTGIIGAALVTELKTTRKSIQSMSASKVAIAGLYGIMPGGKTASIISAISSRDEATVQDTSITRVYQSPDGALVIHYSSHPNSCVIGKVAVGADTETCIVLKSDLPKNFRVVDENGGYVNENSELVKFDQVGGTYLNISGSSNSIGCEPAGMWTDTIFAVRADGTKEVLLTPQDCARGISTWSTLDNGGVVYAQFSSTDKGSVSIWQNEQASLLKSGLLVTPNGIHSMPGGKTVILVHDFSPNFSPSVSGSQGGVFVYDQTTGSLLNWLHLRANNPEHAIEDVFWECGCTVSTLYSSGATSNGEELFGLTRGSTGTYAQDPGGMPNLEFFPIAVRLYPTVSMIKQLPSEMAALTNATLSAATESSLVVAGPDYFTCTLGSLRRPCTYQMGMVDLKDGTYTQLVSPAEGIATLTLSAQTDGDLVLAQSIRISDGRYLIGIIDRASKSVTWSKTSTLSYRFVTALQQR